MSGHTAGPWVAEVTTATFGGWKEPEQIISVWSGNTLIAHYSTASGEFPSEPRCEANAALIADAPAMRLALDLIAAGVASVGTEFVVPHFVIRGGWADMDYYDITGTYTSLINAIGWDRAREALAAARGGV